MNRSTVSRRDMLKTSGLFAISPLAFKLEQPKLIKESLNQTIFFGRNIKRKLDKLDFKPWLQKCNNLYIQTTWNNNWDFERGKLGIIGETTPETTLDLFYPNWSLEFKSFDKTWYGSHQPYNTTNLPPINGIHIVYNQPNDNPLHRLSQHSFDNKWEYIQLDNVEFVSCIYMKDCKATTKENVV